ncbi:hypothetical protein Tco_1458243 [Tanacetum coccineum]
MPVPEHPPSPDYVHGPKYPEYLVPSDDEVPIEDHPLPTDASLTTLSPGYVADSNPSEEDPEEDPAEFLFIPDTVITKAGTKLLLQRAHFSCSWDTLGISTLKASAADT